jgi:hypothetical protein
LPPEVEWLDSDRVDLVAQIKRDFGRHGKAMGEVRKHLEPWVEFVNPYQRIRRTVERMQEQLDALGLRTGDEDVASSQFSDMLAADDQKLAQEAKERWQELGNRYHRAFPLCFSIRLMLPVLAESFVNHLLHVLLRPEIKSDARLRENVMRQPIDVRIKSLHINCVGFRCAVDYSSDACKAYHSLVNERNDLLHGNLVIDKMKFNEVFFWGTVPVFNEYQSMWQRACGVQARMVGLDRVSEEQRIVDNLIGYLTLCLEPTLQPQIKMLAASHELGVNQDTQRLGVLFDTTLVDFRMRWSTPSDKGDAPDE